MENEKRGEHFSKGDINAYNPDILTGTAQIKKNQDMRIHPIFRPEKFDPILDYKTAFEEAALLASRLLHSKQSYHWLFALWFGDNKQSRVPYHFRNMSSPDVPEEYTVNRGIGELTRYEIDAVDQQLAALSRRVRFDVLVKNPDDDRGYGKCTAGRAKRGQRTFPATISITREFYNAMIRGGGHQTSGERATLLFAMALTLLHEMAHAAHFHTMADRPEDFFEDALVAEGGYEYESRIFGMVADIKYTNPPHGERKQWQNITFLDQSAGAYPVIEVCRNTEKLSIKSIRHPFDAKFAERLLGDEWWEGKEKVARDRSADIIPGFLLREENAHLLATTPASFQDWIHSTAKHQRGVAPIEAPPSGPLSRLRTSLRPRLRVRKSTDPCDSTATTLEVDPEPRLEHGILCHTPLPFPQSAEDIRRVFPVHGGIPYKVLMRRFSSPTSPLEEQCITELVEEVCRFDRVSKILVLRESVHRHQPEARRTRPSITATIREPGRPSFRYANARFPFPKSPKKIRRAAPVDGEIEPAGRQTLFVLMFLMGCLWWCLMM